MSLEQITGTISTGKELLEITGLRKKIEKKYPIGKSFFDVLKLMTTIIPIMTMNPTEEAKEFSTLGKTQTSYSQQIKNSMEKTGEVARVEAKKSVAVEALIDRLRKPYEELLLNLNMSKESAGKDPALRVVFANLFTPFDSTVLGSGNYLQDPESISKINEFLGFSINLDEISEVPSNPAEQKILSERIYTFYTSEQFKEMEAILGSKKQMFILEVLLAGEELTTNEVYTWAKENFDPSILNKINLSKFLVGDMPESSPGLDEAEIMRLQRLESDTEKIAELRNKAGLV